MVHANSQLPIANGHGSQLPEGAILNNPACNVGWRRVIVCDGVPEARALLAHLTACTGKLRDCVEQQAGGL